MHHGAGRTSRACMRWIVCLAAPAAPGGGHPAHESCSPRLHRRRDLQPQPACVAHAIASVRRSTITDWELIVVGDHCTDDTEAVVAGFADPRITWVNLPENAGEQSGPNNEGIRRARGRYLAFLNHDDLYFPDHLATSIACCEADRRRPRSGRRCWSRCPPPRRTSPRAGSIPPERRHPRRRLRPARLRVRVVLADAAGAGRSDRAVAVGPRDLRHRVAGLALPGLAQRRAAACHAHVGVLAVPASLRAGSYLAARSPSTITSPPAWPRPASAKRALERAAIAGERETNRFRFGQAAAAALRGLLFRPASAAALAVGAHPYALAGGPASWTPRQSRQRAAHAHRPGSACGAADILPDRLSRSPSPAAHCSVAPPARAGADGPRRIRMRVVVLTLLVLLTGRLAAPSEATAQYHRADRWHRRRRHARRRRRPSADLLTGGPELGGLIEIPMGDTLRLRGEAAVGLWHFNGYPYAGVAGSDMRRHRLTVSVLRSRQPAQPRPGAWPDTRAAAPGSTCIASRRARTAARGASTAWRASSTCCPRCARAGSPAARCSCT